jgi:hypothetical protein
VPFDHAPGTRARRSTEAMLVMLSQLATAVGAVREWIAPDEGWRGRARNAQLDSSKAQSTIP